MADPFLPLVVAPDCDHGPAGDGHWWVVRTGDVLMAESGELPYGGLPVQEATETPIILGAFGPRLAWASASRRGTEAPPGTRSCPCGTAAKWTSPFGARRPRLQLVAVGQVLRYCRRLRSGHGRLLLVTRLRYPCVPLRSPIPVSPGDVTLVERAASTPWPAAATSAAPMYSCLAGFVEPGETLEETFRREDQPRRISVEHS